MSHRLATTTSMGNILTLLMRKLRLRGSLIQRYMKLRLSDRVIPQHLFFLFLISGEWGRMYFLRTQFLYLTTS
jgi:hypothetical protein